MNDFDIDIDALVEAVNAVTVADPPVGSDPEKLPEAPPEAPAPPAAPSVGTMLVVMSAPALRRISPPLTTGDYLFRPGEAVRVASADAAVLIGHEGLLARGVTFNEAPAGTAAPSRRKQKRGCCGGRKQ